MTKPTTVALLGTGLMGFPMSENVLKAGFNLSVWNRTQSKADPLTDQGARVSSSAADAVMGADFVISMLSDGSATKAVLADTALQANLSKGAVWVEMSSIKPEQAREQANLLRSIGVDHLDAPVSGGTKGAEAGSLAIMVGGEKPIFDRAESMLNAMGRPVHVGPSGSGQLSKLANQTIVAITIGAVAEAMMLLEAGGADPAAVRDALKGGFADSTILQQHGARMTDRDFEPGGLSYSQLKDLNNALEEAAGLNLTLPSAESVRDRFVHLVTEMDGAELDHSALYLELARRNDREV